MLEAEYTEELGHTGDSICAMLRDKGYSVEARDAAQIMIYAGAPDGPGRARGYRGCTYGPNP